MRHLAVLALFIAAGSVLAGSAPPPDPVAVAIHRLSPAASITSVTAGPLPNFVTALVDGQPLYVSTDGRYVLQGHLYDMARGEDLSERMEAASRVAALKTLRPQDKITIAPPHPLYRVTAFVDIDCPYCEQLVNHLDAYLAQGIAFDFVSFPRAGTANNPAYASAVSVWCTPDRRAALRDAYAHRTLPARVCDNPVAKEYQLAVALQVPGTPALVAPDGTVLGGLVDPVRLRHSLDALRTKSNAMKAP
ncbi:DsbC family protein [Rhodanobacter sp. FW106-PBR-R2A-1-13]|uniref:DsbC family protein n=1 Tax=Rhodanobacter sp. FW106-PBR-R2A-1-13 TaxID=3454845 RepID=UPI0034E5420A